MNLGDLADAAQIVSAAGVIAGLVYLGVQIRQSATVTRAQIRQQLAGQQITLIAASATDSTLRSAITKNLKGDDLSEDESRGLTQYALASLRLFESVHALWEMEIVADADWKALADGYVRRLSESWVYRDVFEHGRHSFNPQFTAMLDKITEESRAA